MERTVEVLDAEAFKSNIKIWTTSCMSALVIGDIFKLLEPGGELVTEAGHGIFKATSMPYTKDGIIAVDVEKYFL